MYIWVHVASNVFLDSRSFFGAVWSAGMLAPLYGGGFSVAFCQLALFYYGCGVVLHYILPRIVATKNIQQTQRNPGDVQRDAVSSLGPIAVKAGIWTAVEYLQKTNSTKLYTGKPTSIRDVVYLLVTVALLDVLHDTWFYWTHRLLHWRPLYVNIHYMHHRSRAPTAFTGYSFHVIEALIVFANEIIVCFLFPIHMGLHRVYHIFTTIIHEGGHAGYEIAPFIPTFFNLAWVVLGGGFKTPDVFNTVQHHDMHHRYPKKHFSLYFTCWDRLLGTLHPKYDAELFKYFA